MGWFAAQWQQQQAGQERTHTGRYTHTQTHTDTETDTHRHRDRHTDTRTHRQTQTHTDTDTHLCQVREATRDLVHECELFVRAEMRLWWRQRRWTAKGGGGEGEWTVCER